jgi:hypothetical protein
MLWRPGAESAVVREFRMEMTLAGHDVLAADL